MSATSTPETRAAKRAINEQFDLFCRISPTSLRDQREMMERPFFSLAKTKRVKAIDYTSPDGNYGSTSRPTRNLAWQLSGTPTS
ncbi:hypothetical protein [Sphingopyxis sp.]|uniref:hypothetical protein n=1 Tax=Sphingopyxis sp. TaxID=1908224 RepID=UPI003450F433